MYDETIYEPDKNKIKLEQYKCMRGSDKMKILQCTPDIRKFMNKINLQNWEDNEIESMYLEPLNQRFKEL